MQAVTPLLPLGVDARDGAAQKGRDPHRFTPPPLDRSYSDAKLMLAGLCRAQIDSETMDSRRGRDSMVSCG